MEKIAKKINTLETVQNIIKREEKEKHTKKCALSAIRIKLAKGHSLAAKCAGKEKDPRVNMDGLSGLENILR